MEIIDLSGNWQWSQNPEEKFSDGFILPGSTCDNKIGKKAEPFTEINRDSVRCLVPAYDYIGSIYLKKEIEVPEDWKNSYITLFMERVNIASDVWIDGIKAGRTVVSLSTPHIYDLSKIITPGIHTITIRVTNENILNIDHISSGYSEDTQSIWCGIVGRIALQKEDIFHIERIAVFPRDNSIDIKATIDTDCRAPKEFRRVDLLLSVQSIVTGDIKEEKRYPLYLYNRRQNITVNYDMGENILRWSEAEPNLYTLTAALCYDGLGDISDVPNIGDIKNQKDVRSTKTFVFGMREFKTNGRTFTINGEPVFLRGTLDCAIFPKTGYPPTDLDSWLYICRQIKNYGLNHIRFHSWCPPEAAFAAADITGVYVLAELPLWMNYDVCPIDTGADPIHEIFAHNEALRISETYGNHPSFVMFSNGNELLGDFDILEKITAQIKAIDDRRLYTLTSNFDRIPTPADDYFCAFAAGGKRLRLQTFRKVLWEGTHFNFDPAVEEMDIPEVSFEVGQYCVYPDVNSIDKFDGNLLPLNFQVIKDDLEKKGLLDRANEFVEASGKLAALLYKEDIEAALRTKDLGGFELLGLEDYTGQCTATIGLLDQFYHSKGIIAPEEFSCFCGDSVPLFESRRIFKNNETLIASVYLSDRKGDINYTLTLSDFGNEIFSQSGVLPSEISIPLDFVNKPSMLKVTLSTKLCHNSWNIFVYPESINEPPSQIPVLDGFNSEALKIVENGGTAIILGTYDNLKNPIEGKFFPVFWSPAYFPSTNSCGLICKEDHALFKDFPTGRFSDFQWYHPMESAVNFDLGCLPRRFRPIVEAVPNFCDNTPQSPLFEAAVGKGNFIFCGFTKNNEFIEQRHLWNAIVNYACSPDFTPKEHLNLETVLSLFK